MRIVLANYRYYVSGGPEKYMFAVTDMLEGAGHEVVPFSIRYAQNRYTPWSRYFVDPIAGDNQVYFRDHSKSPRTLVKALERAFYARDVERHATALANAVRPDVALVQHYLRKLSPSLLVAMRRTGVPIVVRLSDFGMVCPSFHLLRDAAVCRLCIDHGLRCSIVHRCVQDSFAASVVACASLTFARWRRYFDLVDCFIAPSEIMRGEMIAGGVTPDRIVVLPTFVDTLAYDVRRPRERRIAYAGRLAPEKGAHVLVQAHAKVVATPGLEDVELVLAGNAPRDYAERLRALAGRRLGQTVKFAGELDQSAVRDLLVTSMVSVAPSLWYENLPNAILESFAAGTPVVASDLGSMREAVHGTEAGVLVPPGDADALAGALIKVLQDQPLLAQMRSGARHLAESRYSPGHHLAGLLAVLDKARGMRTG